MARNETSLESSRNRPKLPDLMNSSSCRIRPKQPDLNSSSWGEIQGKMHAGDFVLVLHKKLTTSDVNPHQSRVFLNKDWMEKDLIPKMNKREESLLLGNGTKGLPVTALDPARWRYRVVIKLWPTINQYALKKEWTKIVKKNGWKKDDSVSIWAFRRGGNGKLCLFVEVE